MMRWVESLAASAKRFVWAAAQDAFGNHFTAAAMVVTFLAALGAHLTVFALERFVADLLAVVTLVRPHPTFEHPRVS